MEPIEGSETSAIRSKTPGNYPKENILHIEHGESLKSRNIAVFQYLCLFVFYISDAPVSTGAAEIAPVLSNPVMSNLYMKCSRTFLIYLFLRIAGVSYGPSIACVVS
jgi:p-aminobenzoyl-glutamate transporter AbgT